MLSVSNAARHAFNKNRILILENTQSIEISDYHAVTTRLCGLVVRVLGYRSGFNSRRYQKKKE
jgi:hypothetical protein